MFVTSYIAVQYSAQIQTSITLAQITNYHYQGNKRRKKRKKDKIKEL